MTTAIKSLSIGVGDSANPDSPSGTAMEEDQETDTEGDTSPPPLDSKLLSEYLEQADLVSSDKDVELVGGTLIMTLKGIAPLLAATQQDITFDLHNFLETGEKVPLNEDTGMKRAAPQDFGFDQKLTHNHDMIVFKNRLIEAQKWHTDKSVRQKYLAPLLPVIQSSGTGKSRLFYSYRQHNRTSCRSILLKDKTSPKAEKKDSFDVEFEVPTDGALSERKNKLRELVKSQCKECLHHEHEENTKADVENDGINEEIAEQNTKDVVLLFDEAQHLTVQDNGYLFRVLRWIVREKKFMVGNVKFRITVALAGTNSKLANFFPEKDEMKSSASSRYYLDNPSIEYYNIEDRPFDPFEPFFTFRTQGCFSERHAPSKLPDQKSYQTEYQRMIRFSRPLFALLYKEDKLDNDVEYDIARKIVLGGTSRWFNDRMACLSVLATRVQMGAASSSVVSELVSRGYAHLTFFQNKSNVDSYIPNLASFAFLPDPVCARIAMGLMDDTYQLKKKHMTDSPRSDDLTIKGTTKANIVNKMRDIFSGGICLPAKGDVGEVAVALYLLFCGDVIRMKNKHNLEFDRSLYYHTISVDYTRWMKALWNGGKLEDDGIQRSKLEVNCIQFFRYSFRKSTSELADQSFLKSLYDKGCAIYCFTNTEAVDLVIACRDTENENEEQYIPIYVSVKNYRYMSPAEGTNFLESSFETLKGAGVAKGLLLLAIAGQDRKVVECRNYEKNYAEQCKLKDTLVTSNTSADNLAAIIRKDLYAGFLCLHNDDFGINKMLNDLSLVKKKQTSEVYGMHSELLHGRLSSSTSQLPSSYSKSAAEFFDDTLGCCVKDVP